MTHGEHFSPKTHCSCCQDKPREKPRQMMMAFRLLLPPSLHESGVVEGEGCEPRAMTVFKERTHVFVSKTLGEVRDRQTSKQTDETEQTGKQKDRQTSKLVDKRENTGKRANIYKTERTGEQAKTEPTAFI